MATYTDAQKVYFREIMGFTKLFSSAVSDFENTLNTIQSISFDDGSTFNETINLLTQIQNIDQQISNNAYLGLGSQVNGKVVFDAYRNDVMLRRIGRSLIGRLAIMFSMQPARDYYARAIISRSGLSTFNDYSNDPSDDEG